MTYAKKIVTCLSPAEVAGRWFKSLHVTSETELITAKVKSGVFCPLPTLPDLGGYLSASRVTGLSR
jgi:hypothetical protein